MALDSRGCFEREQIREQLGGFIGHFSFGRLRRFLSGIIYGNPFRAGIQSRVNLIKAHTNDNGSFAALNLICALSHCIKNIFLFSNVYSLFAPFDCIVYFYFLVAFSKINKYVLPRRFWILHLKPCSHGSFWAFWSAAGEKGSCSSETLNGLVSVKYLLHKGISSLLSAPMHYLTAGHYMLNGIKT